MLEIDLLRRGSRAVDLPAGVEADYLLCLTRANNSQTDIWTVDVTAALPALPVPLAPPDPDVVLDLQKALDDVYEDAAYELSVDYAADPPPPKMKDAKRIWIRSLCSGNSKK